MFSTADEEVVAVDWQTLSIGLPARDLAYLLGTGLAPADRRTHERPIVEAWHAALVRLGVAGYTLAEAWADYRFAMVQGRSEEHTSELQSLMRISYAVFCL